MKIDHLVVSIDEKYQNDSKYIRNILEAGFLYKPKWGKRTSLFSVSNIWIGNEYFEMLCLKSNKESGWKEDWVKKYYEGNRGLLCLFFSVNNIEEIYIKYEKFKITKPNYLQFKWFFNLFTRTMPWKNSYFPFLEGMPIQIGFQQMKDKKSQELMEQYMVPNSRENGIQGIKTLQIQGQLTLKDIELLKAILPNFIEKKDETVFMINEYQNLVYKKSDLYNILVETICTNETYTQKSVQIENITVRNCTTS